MSTEDKYDKVFKELYYDKKSPLLFADKRRLYQAVKGAGKPLTSQASLAVLPTSTSSFGLTALNSGPTKEKISSMHLQIRPLTYT